MKAWSALLVFILLLGCAERTEPLPGPGRAVLPDTTRVLDDEALTGLEGVSAEGRYSFTTTSPVLQSLAVGDVIIAGVSGLTPQGALRTVDAITRQGAGTDLGSQQNGLTLAVTTGGWTSSRGRRAVTSWSGRPSGPFPSRSPA